MEREAKTQQIQNTLIPSTFNYRLASLTSFGRRRLVMGAYSSADAGNGDNTKRQPDDALAQSVRDTGASKSSTCAACLAGTFASTEGKSNM